MTRYCKPWLSIEDQVQKLADRGLVISNVSQAWGCPQIVDT